MQCSVKFSGYEGIDDDELGCSGRMSGMHIAIPHIGTINIERDGAQVSTLPGNEVQNKQQPPDPLTEAQAAPTYPSPHRSIQQNSTTVSGSSDANFDFEAGTGDGVLGSFPGFSTGVDDWTLEGVDVALFETIFRGSAASDDG